MSGASRQSPQKLTAYQELERVFARYYYLRRTASLLQWDAAVMMPKGGASVRGKQLAAQTAAQQQQLTGKFIGRCLIKAEQSKQQLNDWQAANLREMQRLHRLHNAIPTHLQEKLSEQTVIAEQAWREAREVNNCALFFPHFKTLMALVRQKAEILAQTFNVTPYEGLMQEYDTGLSEDQLDILFSDLASLLPPLLREIQAKQSYAAIAEKKYALSIAQQKMLSRIVLKRLGFDFNCGRFDSSAHPFTEGGVGDIRVTTRFDVQRPLSGLLGSVHECGHALYDAHLPQDWYAQPVGYDRGMAMHEGVALFYEMAIARTPAFVDFLMNIFHEQGWDLQREVILAELLDTQPGCIRVDAGEASYIPHIVLRYRAERMMLRNDFKIEDLSDYWNEQMRDLLGTQPSADSEGWLQDIHWSLGLFGYFPCYGIGALLAASLYADIAQTMDMQGDIVRGDFSAILIWLEKHIFSQGSLLTMSQLFEKVNFRAESGKYLAYLRQKFLN